MIDGAGVLPFQPDVVIQHSEGDRGFRIGTGLKFQVEDLVIGLEEDERIGADGFLDEFGFEDFNIAGSIVW